MKNQLPMKSHGKLELSLPPKKARGTLKASLLVFCATFGVVQQANASDPCAIFLCMAGEAMGQGGGSACNAPIKDFFDIRKFKKGKFNGGRTSSARSSKLNQCPGADPASKNSIINKFGHVWG